MTNEKIIKARQVQKHDTEENWLKAENFVPKAGEIIIYDADQNNESPRIKVGDGKSNILKLPYASESLIRQGEGVDSIVQVITHEGGTPEGATEPLDNKPKATGVGALALGDFCEASGNNAAAIGYNNKANGKRAFASGASNTANGDWSNASNSFNNANGENSSAFGHYTSANGKNSTTMGNITRTGENAENAVAEGFETQANGINSHASGNGSIAEGKNSYAGGFKAKAAKDNDFAHGLNVEASGGDSMATGNGCKALGSYSRAGGLNSTAKSAVSFAHGNGLITNNSAQAVFGKFNAQKSKALFIVGNGTDDKTRSNALEVYDDQIILGGKALAASDIERITKPTEVISHYTYSLDDLRDLIKLATESDTLKEQPTTHLLQGCSFLGHYYAIMELRMTKASQTTPDSGSSWIIADIYTGTDCYKMYTEYISTQEPGERFSFHGPYKVATKEYVDTQIESVKNSGIIANEKLKLGETELTEEQLKKLLQLLEQPIVTDIQIQEVNE